jgi:methylated-DNA-[protein]-cysteine S-methyltransferase
MPLPAPETGAKTDTQANAAVHRMTVASPVGNLTLFEHSDAITDLIWSVGTLVRNAPPTALLAQAAAQLEAYFAGTLVDFDLPLAPKGTAFMSRVWWGLREIPAGTTLTYGGLAQRLDSGPRAVGRACGANPIPIIIPCHRVLGAGGKLHGYSGKGGIITKAALLRLEGVTLSV